MGVMAVASVANPAVRMAASWWHSPTPENPEKAVRTSPVTGSGMKLVVVVAAVPALEMAEAGVAQPRMERLKRRQMAVTWVPAAAAAPAARVSPTLVPLAAMGS